MQNEEKQKNELKKQQEYSTDVFKNKKREVKIEEHQKEPLELVEYKDNIFKKIFNFIRKIFHIYNED